VYVRELQIAGALLHWRFTENRAARPAKHRMQTITQPRQLHPALAGLAEPIDALREVGTMFWQRGWSVGTSSNYSIVLNRNPLELLVTASGKDKGRLQPGDFVRVGSSGKPTADGQPKSSAETLLHVVAAQQPGVGAVLHTHSVWSTVLSDLFFGDGGFELSGYEMLKGLEGIVTHETSAWVDIFDNTQDISSLAGQVRERMNDPVDPLQYGYLIRRHGLYTWGRDLEEARRHVEIFEFLFECVARRLVVTGELKAVVG
jgi:methylthioribulose-1-phosphate dehydratase